MVNTATVEDFIEQRGKLPGDREKIAAVGPYILELYFDPLGQQPKSIIEVNMLHDDGVYEKVTSMYFEPEAHDDPEETALTTFRIMSKSVNDLRRHI